MCWQSLSFDPFSWLQRGRMKTFSRRICRSGSDFERAARDWLAVWGFEDARLTEDGPDEGMAIASMGAVAQVKVGLTSTSLGEVQRLKGAAHDGRAAFIFSMMDYTSAARDFADKANVRLFRFSSDDGAVEAANSAASRFLAVLAESSGDATIGLALSELLDVEAHGELMEIALGALSVASLSGGFVVLSHSKRDDRYVQFHAAAPEVLECVGRAFTAYSAQELVRLIEVGWPPTEELEAGSRMNFSYPLTSELDIKEVARVAVDTLIAVHGVRSTEDLCVTVDGGLVD